MAGCICLLYTASPYNMEPKKIIIHRPQQEPQRERIVINQTVTQTQKGWSLWGFIKFWIAFFVVCCFIGACGKLMEGLEKHPPTYQE